MSAYIVDSEIIATIATAVHRSADIPADALNRLIDELCDHNARSVAYRYRMEPDAAVQSFTGMHPRIWRKRAHTLANVPIDPIALEDACRCYRYQSCEHPDWEGSTVDQLTIVLHQSAKADAQRAHETLARDRQRAQEQARIDARERSRAWVAAHHPAWATHAIVAELHENTSDVQTDYFDSRRTQAMVLGWSKHGRQLFAEMRKAASTRPETAHLGLGGSSDQEHRENYSMGRGYFMATHRYSGWHVRKVSIESLDYYNIED